MRIRRYAKHALVALFVVSLGAVAYVITNTPENAPEQPKQAVAAPVVEQQPPTVEELLRLVNEERAKVGVKPLKISKAKMVTAQWKADDMYKNNYFSHFPPVIDGKPNTQKVTLNRDMAELTRKACIESSENIYKQTPKATSFEAVEWWMNSKPHRLAIQNTSYESAGFGVSNDQIVVLHFCNEQ